MIKTSIKRRKGNSIDEVIKTLEKNLPNGMEKVMEHGQQIALQNKNGKKDKNLIPFRLEKNKNKVIGTLYTNFEHAPFLEFGTGTKAELPHIGTTKTFIKSGYRYWYLPKEIADAKGIEISPSRIIEIDKQEFYIMYAQSPQPFMQPTAFDLEKSALEILGEELVKGK